MPTCTPARRPSCSRCQRPTSTCQCAWVRPTANQVSVLLLQHPAEVNHAKGSARLLQLSLIDCTCQVGERFDPQALLGDALSHTALLYPATAPTTVPAPPALARTAVRRLVVLDGTWRQSRSLLRLNPWLQRLPRFTLAQPPPSLYLIRQPQAADQRSTLEATCMALGELEARPERYAPLLQAFEGWIGETQRLQTLKAQARLREAGALNPW